jgi:hypothetical protein
MHRFGISETNPPKDAAVIEYMVVLARLAADGSVLGDVGSFVRAIGSFVSILFSKCYQLHLNARSRLPSIGLR